MRGTSTVDERKKKKKKPQKTKQSTHTLYVSGCIDCCYKVGVVQLVESKKEAPTVFFFLFLFYVGRTEQ